MNFEKEKMIAGHACMTGENFLTAVSVAKAYETIIYTVVTDFLSGLKMQLSESLGDDWVIEDNVNDCLRAVSAFMPQKSTTIIGLKRSECYHRVYFMYKTGE